MSDESSEKAGVYESVLRSLLFRLDPEIAHAAAQWLLRSGFPWSAPATPGGDRLNITVGPWKLDSPFGLAAGLDKNGTCFPGLQRLGLDFASIGSVTERASNGNPRPRLLRLPETSSLINCYGLPSSGIDEVVKVFQTIAARPRQIKVIANIYGDGIDGMNRLASSLAPLSDGIELALRCPNVGETKSIYPRGLLRDLLGSVRDRLPDTPLLLKIPPFDNEAEEENRLELVLEAIDFAVIAVTIPGTYTSGEPRLSRKSGSVSGRLTFARTLKAVKSAAAVSQNRIAIKASGGVHTGKDALELIQAGASMIEIFTALVYRGWNVGATLKQELCDAMHEQGIDRLASISRFSQTQAFR